jgi:transposase-like protein
MMFMTRSATVPKRRTFTAEFKSQLVLRVTPALRACASVSGEQSAAELCRQHQIKPQLLSEWKAVFLQNAPTVFQSDVRLQEAELRVAELERQIGRQTMELEAAHLPWRAVPGLQAKPPRLFTI